MSNDAALSSAERKEKKEKRRQAKAAKKAAAAAAEETSATATPAPKADTVMEGTQESGEKVKANKDKKDKKRKREAEVEGFEGEGEQSKEDEKAERKRLKKEKKAAKAAAKAASGSISATSSAPTPSSASIPAPALAPAASATDGAAYLAEHNITVSDSSLVPVLSFDSLDIDARLRPTFANFKAPSPIQAVTWPALLSGKDAVGIAETGSGKTLGFSLPGISRILAQSPKSKDVSILVVAPTRELAIQTYETISKLGQLVGFKSICLFGGVSKDDQRRELNKTKPRVVVGTPGRLLDMSRDGGVNLTKVSYLVLDEADRMLDAGFEKDIRAIIEQTPTSRQTAMFSATWPQSVRALAANFMSNPVRVTVGSDELSANSRVDQVVEVLDDNRLKDGRLTYHLRDLRKTSPKARILVFALYKKEASRIESTLRRNGHNVVAIHGDLGQIQRMKALDEFRTGRVPLMVATDVAARGLDIPNVECVINVTFPLTIEDYVHRIGRTGRGGAYGKSITFFTDNDKAHAGELKRLLRDGGYEIPAGLEKFSGTIKKKEHSAYGAFFKDIKEEDMKKATKITFD